MPTKTGVLPRVGQFSFPAKDATVSDILSEGGMVTLLPDQNRTDGFFIARLRRK